MEIKEAIGYLQAVADNAQSTPKYQRALEMAIAAMESHEVLVDKNKELVDRITSLEDKVADLELELPLWEANYAREYERAKKAETELRDERDRFDKLSDFELAEAQELTELKKKLAPCTDAGDAAEKSVYSYRDALRQYRPDCVSELFAGGAHGCPKDYFTIPNFKCNNRCDDCWGEKYKGEAYRGGDTHESA